MHHARHHAGSGATTWGPMQLKTVCVCSRLWCVALQGLLGTLMQRLHEFDFQLSTLQLKPLQMLPPCQQPSALRAALQHLSQMQVAADTELRLSGLHWDAAAAEAVAAAAPLLPQYRLCTQVGQLTDGLLGTILRMGTSLKELTVDKVVLQSDQHADVQWPWELLRVGRGMVDTDMSVFLRLPAPATDTANPPVVYTAYPWQLVSTTQVGVMHAADNITTEGPHTSMQVMQHMHAKVPQLMHARPCLRRLQAWFLCSTRTG